MLLLSGLVKCGLDSGPAWPRLGASVVSMHGLSGCWLHVVSWSCTGWHAWCSCHWPSLHGKGWSITLYGMPLALFTRCGLIPHTGQCACMSTSLASLGGVATCWSKWMMWHRCALGCGHGLHATSSLIGCLLHVRTWVKARMQASYRALSAIQRVLHGTSMGISSCESNNIWLVLKDLSLKKQIVTTEVLKVYQTIQKNNCTICKICLNIKVDKVDDVRRFLNDCINMTNVVSCFLAHDKSFAL